MVKIRTSVLYSTGKMLESQYTTNTTAAVHNLPSNTKSKFRNLLEKFKFHVVCDIYLY